MSRPGVKIPPESAPGLSPPFLFMDFTSAVTNPVYYMGIPASPTLSAVRPKGIPASPHSLLLGQRASRRSPRTLSAIFINIVTTLVNIATTLVHTLCF